VNHASPACFFICELDKDLSLLRSFRWVRVILVLFGTSLISPCNIILHVVPNIDGWYVYRD